MKIVQHLKAFIVRWPPLYRLLSRVSIIFRPVYLKGLLVGSRAWEEKWENIHLEKRNDWGGEDDDVIGSYRDSTGHAHRAILTEKIRAFSPRSVLEIGSNCGPNLYLLAGQLPEARLFGIDLNRQAIETGNKWFAENGIDQATMEIGRADDLSRFADNSIDVIFTDAVLIFIGPDKIKQVTQEMLRVARSGLVLAEWQIFGGSGTDREISGVRQDGLWKRDYKALFERDHGVKKVEISRITADIWPDRNWQTVGAIIQVRLR